MTWGTVLAGIAILGMAVSWYGLQFVALRDLHARARVRSGNRVLWALVILCVPYLGALGYTIWGPTGAPARTARPELRPAAPTRLTRADAAPVVPAPRARRPEPSGVSSRHTPTYPVRPAMTIRRPTAPLSRDPVIGTDMSELLQRRSGISPLVGTQDTIIRWPGSSAPAAAPVEFRD